MLPDMLTVRKSILYWFILLLLLLFKEYAQTIIYKKTRPTYVTGVMLT